MIVYLFEDMGAFFVRWFCPVPEIGIRYIVVKDDWIPSENPDKWIRQIYEIKICA